MNDMDTYVGCKGGNIPGVLLLESTPRDVFVVSQIRSTYPGDLLMGNVLKHIDPKDKVTRLDPLTQSSWYRAKQLSKAKTEAPELNTTEIPEDTSVTDTDDESDSEDKEDASSSSYNNNIVVQLVNQK